MQSHSEPQYKTHDKLQYPAVCWVTVSHDKKTAKFHRGDSQNAMQSESVMIQKRHSDVLGKNSTKPWKDALKPTMLCYSNPSNKNAVSDQTKPLDWVWAASVYMSQLSLSPPLPLPLRSSLWRHKQGSKQGQHSEYRNLMTLPLPFASASGRMFPLHYH